MRMVIFFFTSLSTNLIISIGLSLSHNKKIEYIREREKNIIRLKFENNFLQLNLKSKRQLIKKRIEKKDRGERERERNVRI